LLLSSIQAYSIENLYASSPETRGIKVEIEGKDGKPAPESVTIISSNARSQFTLSGLVLDDNNNMLVISSFIVFIEDSP
jgi:hypothetical protein